MQKIKDNDKCYAIPDCLMLCDCRIEVLYKLFYFYKDDSSLFFMSKWLYNLKIIQKFFEN